MVSYVPFAVLFTVVISFSFFSQCQQYRAAQTVEDSECEKGRAVSVLKESRERNLE